MGLARIAIALSTMAAIAAHAWLSPDGSALRWLGPVALAVAALGGRFWPRGAIPLVFGIGHVWPLAVFLVSGATDLGTLVVWLSMLAGLAFSLTPIQRWSLPAGWQIPVAAWGLVLALGWPIVLWRELDFTLVTVAQLDVANSMWTGSARHTAAFLTLTTLSQLCAFLVIDMCWARYGRDDGTAFLREVVWPMALGTTAAIIVGLGQGLVDIRWLNLGVWPSLGRAGATFFDANAYGAVAAIWGGLVAAVLVSSATRWVTAIGAALLVASGVAVWVSGSRTALAGWLIIGAGLAATAFGRGRISRRVAAMGLAALVALVVAGALAGGPGTAVRRLWQTLPAPSLGGVTDFARDMWERNGYGVAAVQMIREFPVTGVGPAAFQVLAPDYAFLAIGKPIPPDNAQNWWRHQVAELGLLGSLPAIVASLLVAAAVISLLRRRTVSPIPSLVGASMVALGFMGVVGPPMAHPIVLQTAAVMIFWASWLARPESAGRSMRLSGPMVAVVAIVLPIVWAGLTLHAATTELRPPYRAQRVGWVYNYGFSAADAAHDGERRWAARRAVGVIPAMGSRLVLTLEAPEAGTERGPLRVRVRDRNAVVVETDRSTPDPFTCTIVVPPGERWVMVQIDARGPTRTVDGVERALRVGVRWE